MIRYLSILLVTLICTSSYADEVKTLHDLKAEFEQVGENRVMLLLVSQPGCSYCEQIKEEILNPMVKSDHYKSVLIREIKIHSTHSLRDFQGKRVDATLFAKRYDAWATPTLLFIDSKGNELAPKMIGINTPEFYGYYVDKNLDSAQAALSN